MKTIKLYAIRSITEDSDGFTTTTDIYYANSQEIALKIADSMEFRNKYLNMYCPGSVCATDIVEEKEFTVLDSVKDFDDAEKHATRKKALEKLTAAEKQLLGL